MTDRLQWFGTENAPAINQFAHLFKAAYLRLMWVNGPSSDAAEQIPHAAARARDYIEKYRHLGDGNPVNGHAYRSTATVSSSGFYNGLSVEMVPWATHTINLDETRDATAGCSRNTKHLWNGQIDDGAPRRPDFFEKAAEFFISDWQRDPDCAVHVNCAAGASRAPSMAYFFVRATTKLPVLDCLAIVYAANNPPQPPRNISITYWQDAERTLARLGLVSDAWSIE